MSHIWTFDFPPWGACMYPCCMLHQHCCGAELPIQPIQQCKQIIVIVYTDLCIDSKVVTGVNPVGVLLREVVLFICTIMGRMVVAWAQAYRVAVGINVTWCTLSLLHQWGQRLACLLCRILKEVQSIVTLWSVDCWRGGCPSLALVSSVRCLGLPYTLNYYPSGSCIHCPWEMLNKLVSHGTRYYHESSWLGDLIFCIKSMWCKIFLSNCPCGVHGWEPFGPNLQSPIQIPKVRYFVNLMYMYANHHPSTQKANPILTDNFWITGYECKFYPKMKFILGWNWCSP